MPGEALMPVGLSYRRRVAAPARGFPPETSRRHRRPSFLLISPNLDPGAAQRRFSNPGRYHSRTAKHQWRKSQKNRFCRRCWPAHIYCREGPWRNGYCDGSRGTASSYARRSSPHAAFPKRSLLSATAHRSRQQPGCISCLSLPPGDAAPRKVRVCPSKVTRMLKLRGPGSDVKVAGAMPDCVRFTSGSGAGAG